MENSSKSAKKSNSWLIPTALILIFVAAIAFLLLLLNGQTTVTGEFEGQRNSETLACESEQSNYSIFSYDNAKSKSLKINAVFEDEKLSSISLIYKLDYDSEDEMKKSESINHADINLSFYDDGMETDDLNAKYSFLNNSLQISLYAKNEEINTKSLKYFMLYNIYDVDNLTKDKMAKVYNDKGLDCTIKHNSNKEEENEN